MNNLNPFKKDLQKVRLKLEESIDILINSNYSNKSIINNKECINNKLLELISLINDTIKNKPKKLNVISFPKGFELLQQPGDGTCLYHSIAMSLKLMNINNNFNDGFDDTPSYGTHPNEKTILQKFNILKEKIENKSIWGGSVELSFIAFILKICIYIWDGKTKNWTIFRYEDLDVCNKKNSIFIFYNGSSHYDCLIPKDIHKFNINFPMHGKDLRNYKFSFNEK